MARGASSYLFVATELLWRVSPTAQSPLRMAWGLDIKGHPGLQVTRLDPLATQQDFDNFKAVDQEVVPKGRRPATTAALFGIGFGVLLP